MCGNHTISPQPLVDPCDMIPETKRFASLKALLGVAAERFTFNALRCLLTVI